MQTILLLALLAFGLGGELHPDPSLIQQGIDVGNRDSMQWGWARRRRDRRRAPTTTTTTTTVPKLANGLNCSTASECVSGKCGMAGSIFNQQCIPGWGCYSVGEPIGTFSECCADTITYNEIQYCTNRAKGSMCLIDAQCAGGYTYCDGAVCVDPERIKGQPCTEAKFCRTQKCAWSYNHGNSECCDSTIEVDGNHWCANLNEQNMRCDWNAQCQKGTCDPVRQKCTRLLEGSPCNEDIQCDSLNCGWRKKGGSKVCCGNWVHRVMGDEGVWCTSLPMAAECDYTTQCHLGFCEDNICKARDGATCTKNEDCKWDRCGKTHKRNFCCSTWSVVENGIAYCEVDLGEQCYVNGQCPWGAHCDGGNCRALPVPTPAPPTAPDDTVASAENSDWTADFGHNVTGCGRIDLPGGILSIAMCSDEGTSNIAATGTSKAVSVSGAIEFPCAQWACAPNGGTIEIMKNFEIKFPKIPIVSELFDFEVLGQLGGRLTMQAGTELGKVDATIAPQGRLTVKVRLLDSLEAEAVLELRGWITLKNFDVRSNQIDKVEVGIQLTATVNIGGCGVGITVKLTGSGKFVLPKPSPKEAYINQIRMYYNAGKTVMGGVNAANGAMADFYGIR